MTVNRWGSPSSAFLDYGYPDENLRVVQRAMDAIGIDHYERTKSRAIKAVRRDGGRRLLIKPGYTVGFLSEQEILDTVGNIDRWRNTPREWGITHPVNWIRD